MQYRKKNAPGRAHFWNFWRGETVLTNSILPLRLGSDKASELNQPPLSMTAVLLRINLSPPSPRIIINYPKIFVKYFACFLGYKIEV